MQKDYTVTEEIKNKILEKHKFGCPPADINKLIVELTGWGKTKARETIKKVLEGEPVLTTTAKPTDPVVWFKDEKQWEAALEFKEAYVYNKESDQYVFPSKKVRSGNVVLPGSTVRSLQREYVAGNTINELARRFSIPRYILTEVASKLGLTHDALPFTNEEIKDKSVQDLVASDLEAKKFELYQKLEKEQWRNTQADALKWIEFKYGSYDPFTQFLGSWRPPEYKKVECISKASKADRVFVAGAFDWHFGAREEARYMWKGKEWNLEVASEAINKYTNKIAKHIAKDAVGFNKCVFLMGGDLYNSLTGYTSNGTQLNNEYSKDTQFEAIMNALTFFIKRMLELFPQVECHFVRGNHGGTTDIPLAWAVKNYFRAESRLTFEIASCRTKAIRVKDVLMLLDHGASDQAKSLVPRTGKAKEAYIQSLFLAQPELLVGVKQRLFIQGDLHHFEQHEYNDFEFFMFGALPCGSQYADTKNFHNRPRQNCLIIDEEGVEQVLHIYI